MSLVYAFKCNGCGDISERMPKSWCHAFGQHWCPKPECRDEMRVSAGFEKMSREARAKEGED
jgi:hypothetical protein